MMYYIMAEVTPADDNDEKELYIGAYLNCFIEAERESEALMGAKRYAAGQGWVFERLKEISEAHRDAYCDDDMTEIYDEACDTGAAGIFYTWSEE